MAADAQRLISISLHKIAHGRSQRSGMSLHKNLLVATVLNKARNIFMEETIHFMNSYRQPIVYDSVEEPELATPLQPAADDVKTVPDQEVPDDKENCLPESEEAVYLDLDACKRPRRVLCESNSISKSLKRRRDVVCERETEEAVNMILPKRYRSECYCYSDSEYSDSDDDASDLDPDESNNNGMEVEQITSLVSIFNNGLSIMSTDQSGSSGGKLSRSVSTPDLCSAQVKDGLHLVRTPYLAMTV